MKFLRRIDQALSTVKNILPFLLLRAKIFFTFLWRVLRWIDKTLSKIENILLVLLLGAMIFFAFLRTILRNLFGTGLSGVDEFLGHLVLVVAFIGASQATRLKKHIKIDALSKILTESINSYATILINVFSIAILVILVKASLEHVLIESETDYLVFGVSHWIYQVIMPVGFSIIGYRFLLQLFEEIFIIVERNRK